MTTPSIKNPSHYSRTECYHCGAWYSEALDRCTTCKTANLDKLATRWVDGSMRPPKRVFATDPRPEEVKHPNGLPKK